MQNNEPLIQVHELKKYYPLPKKRLFEKTSYKKAVDSISFSIMQGETFGLVGESGCGKSTTGLMLDRILEPTSGTIKYDGTDISTLRGSASKELRKKMQMVFQDPYSCLNPKKKLSWILEEPLIIHNEGSKDERMKRVRKMVEEVQLDCSMLDRLPHEFSGGQRQRIDIARALMLNPNFIIADEPVSALDVSVRSQILNLMKELQTKFNLTYLFISHDLNVVYYMSDTVGVMYMGKIVELAPVEEIYNNPMHPYTKSLLSAIPSVNPDQKKERIILKGDVQSATSLMIGCPFAPRCPYVMDICNTDVPSVKQFEESHSTMCHLYD